MHQMCQKQVSGARGLTLEAGVFKVIDSLSVDQIDRKGARGPTIIFTQMTLKCDVIEFHGPTHEANL